VPLLACSLTSLIGVGGLSIVDALRTIFGNGPARCLRPYLNYFMCRQSTNFNNTLNILFRSHDEFLNCYDATVTKLGSSNIASISQFRNWIITVYRLLVTVVYKSPTSMSILKLLDSGNFCRPLLFPLLYRPNDDPRINK
jgi:hypothetical protein